MKLDFDQIYTLHESVIFKKEDDGGFLFDPENGNLKYVNRTARAILEQIDGRSDLHQMVRGLQRRYPDQTTAALCKDVVDFFRELMANDFVAPLDATK
jgi:hypothetical protein